MKTGALFAVIVASLMLNATLPSRSATGMDAMQYYVGTWSCIGGTIGKQSFHFMATYAMSGNILRSWISANGYVQSSSITYDSKNRRYVDAAVVNDGTWFVAYRTIGGRTDTSIDHATSDGKLGRLVIVHPSSTNFASTGYSAVSGGKVLFKATCRKQ